MGNELSVASMTKLAKIANTAAANAEQYAADAVGQAIKCGEALNAAKAKCPHGEWLTWLAENFDYCQQTANKFMRLSNYAHERNLESCSSVRQALIAVSEARPKLEQTQQKPQEKPVAKSVEAVELEEEEAIEAEWEEVNELETQQASEPDAKSDPVEDRARRNLRERLRGVRLDLGNLGLGGVYEKELRRIEEGAGL